MNCSFVTLLYCYCFLNEINGDGDGDGGVGLMSGVDELFRVANVNSSNYTKLLGTA